MNKTWFYNNFVFRLVSPLILGVVVYMLVLLFFDSIEQFTSNFFGQEVAFVIVLSFFFLELNRLIIIILNRIHPLNKNFQVRLVLQFLTSASVSAILVSAFLYFYFVRFAGFRTINTELMIFNIIYFFTGLSYHLYYFSFVLLNKRNTALTEEEALKKSNVELEIESLKNQVNPNFLFQSLEIIISELGHNNKLADDLISCLAKVYRFTLDNKDMDLIPVDEELESLNPLLKLFNAKYKDGIKFRLKNESKKVKYLIPGTLQLFFENAIFQNIITEAMPLIFEIEIEEKEVLLKHSMNKKLNNNLNLDAQISKLKKAYGFYTKQQIACNEEGKVMIINIPLMDLIEE